MKDYSRSLINTAEISVAEAKQLFYLQLQSNPHLSERKRVHHLMFRRKRYAVAGVQHPLRIVFQKANRFRKLLILFQQMESADNAGNRFMPAHSQCLQHNIADSAVRTAGNDEDAFLPLIGKGRIIHHKIGHPGIRTFTYRLPGFKGSDSWDFTEKTQPFRNLHRSAAINHLQTMVNTILP